MEEVRYKIGDFAKIVEVSIPTLRQWDRTGRLVAHRTKGGKHFGQRYYTDEQIDYVRENFVIAKCPHCGKNILLY